MRSPVRVSSFVLALLAFAAPALPAEQPADPVAALYKAAERNKSAFGDPALRKEYFTTTFQAIVARQHAKSAAQPKSTQN